MIRLLASLFAFLDKVFGLWRDSKLKAQGRQQAIEEVNDEANRRAELAATATTVPDPARDERLRNRFDRSRSQ